MSESDGIEDALEGQLRVGLLIAGRVAEELARQREQTARAAEQQSAQAVRDLQDRAAAERTTAQAVLVPLERTAWWDRATPADIETAWQTARQWADMEPDAARAAETIREQVRTRYGIDVDALQADDRRAGGRDGALAQALDDHAEQTTAQVQQHRAEADKEAVVATLLASEAADDVAAAAVDGGGGTALAGAELEYDSPQRRAASVRNLHASVGAEHVEAVEAWLSADVANARPITDVGLAAGHDGVLKGRRRSSVGRPRDQARGIER